MCCPKGFNVLRCDRLCGKGGGVLVFYKSELHINRIDVVLPSDSCFELVCVDLYSRSNILCRFCCVYLPPSQPVSVIDSLCATLGPLIFANKPTFLLGDFNLPNIDWSIPSSTSDQSHQKFLSFCSSFSLFQSILAPTHDKGNILDLLLCNYNAKEVLLFTKIDPPPWCTDHFLISSSIIYNDNILHNNSKKKTSYPNFRLGDYEKISGILSNTDWSFILTSNSLQSSYNHFCEILTSIINHHIPLTSSRPRKNKKPPIFIRRLLARKRLLYKQSKSNTSLKPVYKQAAKHYDCAVNKWHDSLESNLCREPSFKKLYGHINNKLNSKRSIPPIEDNDNNLLFDDKDKANAFNSAFQSFFTVDNNIPFSVPSSNNKMPPIKITTDDVLRAGRKIKQKLTRTPEGIPSFFLSKTINSLLYPLTTLFNLFLTFNFVPSQWISAFIIPVFKKGDRCKVGNYRPISLTSSLSRLFEAIILEKLTSYALEKNLISNFQYGFLPNRTSCANLLSSLYTWLSSYSTSNCTSIIYTDIKKAFDSVNHRLLLHILYSFGFDSIVIGWIRAFLSSRQQQVCINDCTSSPLPVHSGVPQGSVIGPFFFLVYYNGITNAISSFPNVNIRLFADDSKLFSTHPNDLQNAINNSEKCLSILQLELAPQKCAILKIKKKSVQESSNFYIKHHLIKDVSKFKDLGILVSNDLKWSSHIDSICHNASITLYQITKSFNSKNIWTWLKLFNTYIRPKLEFNTPVWSPHLIKDIDKIESIQRKFTKFVFNKCNIPFSSYEDRLNKIDYLSLRLRRKYFDLILMYKLINNTSDLEFDDYFLLTTSSYSLRSHALQIKTKQNFKSSQWSYSFFGRIPSYWNTLPSDLVSSPNLIIFKNSLKSYLRKSL